MTIHLQNDPEFAGLFKPIYDEYILTIQQYALMQLRKPEHRESDLKSVYEKLIIRSSFGIINAARNSV
ncbi:MAG: hypothetical protein KA143_06255 [Saprospiraceae bacterium]|nr:hypothetical protein [Saprospiraceae bacterium]